jgi:hypothetical protein
MASTTSRRQWPYALAVALLTLPVTAGAQTSPTTPAHPNLPWGIGIATPQGQLLRYIYMPPQPITLQYLVVGAPPSAPPTAEPPPAGSNNGDTQGAPQAPDPVVSPETTPAAQVVSQQVTVPGYYVRETTVGFHYPQRWIIEQTGPNAYRWRQLPAQFVPK